MDIFISHAVADRPLVQEFLDLLKLGLNLKQEQIFCSSIEGHNIPDGKHFVEYIRQQLTGSSVVIMLITPRYYESAFCMCELGATWAFSMSMAGDEGQHVFPLLVPPLGFEALKAVLGGVQAGKVNDPDALGRLRDRLIAANIASGASRTWEIQRGLFIKKFPRIQAKLSGPTSVPEADHAKLQEAHDALQEEVIRLTDEIRKQQQINQELAECKDRTEAAAVLAGHTDDEETFEKLSSEYKAALSGYTSPFRLAMYYAAREEEWHPLVEYNQEQWADIRYAEEREYLKVSDTDGVSPNNDNRKVAKVLEKLDELRVFFWKASDSYKDAFEDEHGVPLSFTNRELWESFGWL